MEHLERAVRRATAVLAAGWVGTLAPSAAEACGGFFCSASQPVNQAAERIIFADDDDGSVTAIVQLAYEGPSERFSWVLPVPSRPQISVSSNTAFLRLQQATNPVYQLRTRIEGQCRSEPVPGGGGGFVDAGGIPADAGGGGGPPVVVVDSGSVGPFDYVVLQVDAQAADPAAAALTWLADNQYDVGALGPELLREYLRMGMLLVAFRLTKDATAGDVRPVRLTYTSTRPMIPIKLTAVAANEDMPILVWVLGRGRAIPRNYPSLQLNEALIDWIRPSRSYDAVVTAAANEAGGQGFVTELAGAAPPIGEALWTSGDQSAWARLQRDAPGLGDLELLYAAAGAFARYDGFADVLRRRVPVPDGATVEDLVRCLPCVWPPPGGGASPDAGLPRDTGPGVDAGEPDALPGFDRAAFLAELLERVVQPMVDTRALFEAHPQLTRLYTTLSPAEMSLDPEFDFNPDLPMVSNRHEAERIIECAPELGLSEAPWRVLLPSGDTVRGRGASWPLAPGDLPANETVVMASTSGAGTMLENRRAEIEAALAAHNATVPGPGDLVGDGGAGGEDTGGTDPRADAGLPRDSSAGGSASGSSGSSDCGCAVTRGSDTTGLGALAPLGLLALLALRRRR